jgi:hypothetical protein
MEVRLILCAVTAGTIAACGANHAAGFATAVTSGDPESDGGSDDAGPDGPGFSGGPGTDSGLVLTGVGEAGSGIDCRPGTYSGAFTTKVVLGDAAPTALSLDWTGTLTVTLIGHVVNSGNGEDLSPTLTIAPGGRMEGMDNFHGVFGADVTGQLDCPSKTLRAMVMNGVYTIWFSDAATIAFVGTVNGTYDAAATPSLTGSMAITTTSGQLGAEGTVTATLR